MIEHSVDATAGRSAGVETLAMATRKGTWRLSLPHSNPQPTLIWQTRGTAQMLAAGRSYGLGGAAFAYVPAGTGFALTPLAQCQAMVVTLPMGIPLPADVLVGRVAHVTTTATLSGHIDALSRATTDTTCPGRIALAHSLLISAWLEQFNALPKPTAAQTLARRFAARVEQTFHTAPTLADIAADMGVTPTHLTRVMRRTAGQTAAQYLHDRQMHAARRALADTGDSAAAISRALGFSSPAYFSRAFTAHAGKTPGQFRAAAIPAKAA